MHELTDNVARLRAQLREIEIQAESQMHRASSSRRKRSAGSIRSNSTGSTRFQEVTA